MADIATGPVLSLILCSRNDEYMGNSRWRLETTLNYVAEQVEAVGRVDHVEVLVADWGSEVPLSEVIRLSPVAARIVSFLYVPPGIARPLQKDSLFPEVLALNAAARRAGGEYIGRIDQDTLVGRRFLEVFFDLYDGKRKLDVPLANALLYSNRRTIPYWFAVRCPPGRQVTAYIRALGHRCWVHRMPNREFWTYDVGIWLIHRDRWRECGGYDERYIYYNWMEVEMIMRLRKRYPLVDFGEVVDRDFYHLEHRNPRTFVGRRDLGHRINTFEAGPAESLPYRPNSDQWGMAGFALVLVGGKATGQPAERWYDSLLFGRLLAYAGMQSGVDFVYVPVIKAKRRWAKRTERVRELVRGEPMLAWPKVLFGRRAKMGRCP
jgi:hypothetical protein